jgi:hypothetical protein
MPSATRQLQHKVNAHLRTIYVDIPLSGVNLINTDIWKDLIGEQIIDLDSEYLALRPYQTVWISNNSR